MVYCSKCGSEIPEYGNFCPECGTLVHEEQVTSNYMDTNAFFTENHLNDQIEMFSGSANCVERFNLSPAEFMALIFRPKYLDKYFKSPYRITLFYFILKDILELKIRSSSLILFNLDHVSVKKGPLFEKSISTPFKPYESIILDHFRSRNTFTVDTYEKGPLSYKFESKIFKNLFLEELLNHGFFEFEKRSVMSLGAKEYLLTDYGESVREAILSELGYDLEETFSELGTPADYLYILSFFGLDEGMMQDEISKIEILHKKLVTIEKVYERKRGGYSV